MGRGQDEKSEFEFQHPPEARGPWANEVAEERERSVYCQPCKEKGRKQMAHRLLAGRRGICNWCYRGEPHPDDVKAKGKEIRLAAATSHISTTKEEVKEEVMAEKCKCGRPSVHRGRCWVRRGLKAAPEAKQPRGRRAAVAGRGDEESRAAARANGKANGVAAVSVPEAALDKWFAGLGDKERAELQARLWSQLPPELKALVFAEEVGA